MLLTGFDLFGTPGSAGANETMGLLLDFADFAAILPLPA